MPRSGYRLCAGVVVDAGNNASLWSCKRYLLVHLPLAKCGSFFKLDVSPSAMPNPGNHIQLQAHAVTCLEITNQGQTYPSLQVSMPTKCHLRQYRGDKVAQGWLRCTLNTCHNHLPAPRFATDHLHQRSQPSHCIIDATLLAAAQPIASASEHRLLQDPELFLEPSQPSQPHPPNAAYLELTAESSLDSSQHSSWYDITSLLRRLSPPRSRHQNCGHFSGFGISPFCNGAAGPLHRRAPQRGQSSSLSLPL